MANAFVESHRRHGHEARLVTMCECANEFEEDICLHLPFLQGNALDMKLKAVVSALHRNRPKTISQGGVPVARTRGPLERLLFDAREALWTPTIKRAVREHRLDTFDVYHLESGTEFYRDARFLKKLKAAGKKIVCYYLGTDLRNRGVIPAVQELSDLNLTCEWDHLALDPTLTYFFLPFDSRKYEFRTPSTDVLRIAHAPRNRWFKGTEHVIAAIERVQKDVRLEFDLIEGVTHAEADARKRRANLLVDHVGTAGGTTGYGMNSLESLAMGIPCMTSMVPAYEKFLGPHPFLVTTPETLADQLLELARRPEQLTERSKAGREWVERVHGVDPIVEKIYAIYKSRGWM